MNSFNKKIAFVGVAILGIIFSFYVYTQDSTISNLSLISAQVNAQGKYEAPSSITFIEKLGLLYLTSGLSYNFGHSDEVVEIGLQTLLSSDLDAMTETEEENNDIYIADDLDNIDKVIEEIQDDNKTSTSTTTEESTSVDSEVNTETSTEVSTESSTETQEFVWTDLYTREVFKTLDSNGKEFGEDDTTVRYTTPTGLTKENIPTASNIWQLNYRYKKGGLIGVDTSYWSSVLFEDKQVFDRAWTSLKWMCQDYLNAVIVSDTSEVFEAIVYSSDNTYYWYLYLDKLIDYDAFKDGNKLNVIAMTVEPISIDNAYKLMYSLNLVNSATENNTSNNTNNGGK